MRPDFNFATFTRGQTLADLRALRPDKNDDKSEYDLLKWTEVTFCGMSADIIVYQQKVAGRWNGLTHYSVEFGNDSSIEEIRDSVDNVLGPGEKISRERWEWKVNGTTATLFMEDAKSDIFPALDIRFDKPTREIHRKK